MQTVDAGAPALSTEEYISALLKFARLDQPAVFALKARLPTEGRADIPLAATRNMSVVLKAYASGGENELHAHVHEDHVFVVLQGAATFFGVGNATIASLGKYHGILIPRGTHYKFEAGAGDELVMLRIGSVDMLPDPVEAFARVDIEGRDMDSHSAENKEVPTVYGRDAWFP